LHLAACVSWRSTTICCRLFARAMIPALQYGTLFGNSVGWSVQLLLPRVCECLLGWLLDAAHHA